MQVNDVLQYEATINYLPDTGPQNSAYPFNYRQLKTATDFPTGLLLSHKMYGLEEQTRCTLTAGWEVLKNKKGKGAEQCRVNFFIHILSIT